MKCNQTGKFYNAFIIKTGFQGIKLFISNLAISMGNYWQGIVAERFDYAAVFYLDSLFVLIPLLIIPFLRNREERAETIDLVTDLTFAEAQPAKP